MRPEKIDQIRVGRGVIAKSYAGPPAPGSKNCRSSLE
jgi:hypothetical protein